MEDIKENQSFVHLFSSASLTIAEEDWTHLVHSDINLAAQVGLLLLKNNKELELVLDATEKEYEEQRMRADQCEVKMKNLKQMLANQSKIYSSLEGQVEDLTLKYRQLMDDCQKYKDKNKMLWERVESLENECDGYLEEIKTLKDQIKTEENNSTSAMLTVYSQYTKYRRNYSVPDEKTSAFSSSTSTHLPQKTKTTTSQIERTVDNLLLCGKIQTENQKLKERIEGLENQLNISKNSESRRSNSTEDNDQLNDVFYCDNMNKPELARQTSKTPAYFKYNKTNKNTLKENLESLPTVRHYHELFAEIFAKLKSTRTDS